MDRPRPLHDPAVPVPGTDEELDATRLHDAAAAAVPVPAARVRRSTRGGAARDAVRDRARRGRARSSTARASATPCSRPAGRTTATRIEYAAHDVTELLRDGRERARRDRRRRLVRRLRRLRPAPAGQPLRPRARAAVRAAPRARGRHARRSSRPTRAGSATTGPLVYSDLLMGERYDARRELGAVASPVGGRRRRADGVRALGRPSARSRSASPRTCAPVAVTERAPGVHVVDLGQNMVGWVRLRVSRASAARACSCASPRCSSPTARCTSPTCAARASSTPTSCAATAPRSGSRASPSTASATSRSPAVGTTSQLDRPRRALRHAAQRHVRVLRRDGQPALAQHRLGPARQLRLGPDRLPAARRAARLARRRPGVRCPPRR